MKKCINPDVAINHNFQKSIIKMCYIAVVRRILRRMTMTLPLLLILLYSSGKVGTRRERGNQHIHFKDQERVGGWVVGGGAAGVVGDGDELSGLPHDENASSEENFSVHLPILR